MGSLFSIDTDDSNHSKIEIQRYENFVTDHNEIYQKALELRRQHLWPTDNTQFEEYEESDKQSIHFVAMKGDSVVGTLQYHTEINRLRQMIVHPSYRGIGLGSKLVEKVKRINTEWE